MRPITEHLAELGNPTWYARFGAQVMTDPVLREVVVEEAMAERSLQQVLEGLNRSLPALPLEVRMERSQMARQLLVHMIAEHELAMATGRPTARANWRDVGTGLIDAIVGMLLAPVTRNTDA